MKIGFIGAGGTGKTTLAKAIAEAYHLPFIKSPSRACFEKHGVKTEDDQRKLTPEQRWALQYDIFKAIDQQVRENPVGVFDRTHLDNFGYSCLQCYDVMTNAQCTEMHEVTYNGLKTFDLLYFAPIYDWRDNVQDGMRTNSLAARRLHGGFAYEFLECELLEYTELKDECVERRLARIMRQLPKGFH